MIRRIFVVVAILALCGGVASLAATAPTVLPDGWRLVPWSGAHATTGTMPQGIALSPDGAKLAVVESGVNPAALRILDASTLADVATIALRGAFGKPVWIDATHVLVAGANADALFDVDLTSGRSGSVSLGTGTWPAAVALSPDHSLVATADDGNGAVSIFSSIAEIVQPQVSVHTSPVGLRSVRVAAHPADVLFSADSKTLYVAERSARSLAAIDVATRAVTQIDVGLHPSALALAPDGSKLYVAEADDDAVGVLDTATNRLVGKIDVGLHDGRLSGNGASPNALLATANALYVSLGAENAVAILAGGRVVARVPAGWYPTGVALGGGRLYVANGKGEGSRPNPEFDPFRRRSPGYVGATLYGSIRTFELRGLDLPRATAQVIGDAMPVWRAPEQTVLRSNGPIRHVIYVIKENRSYDQVLGDLGEGDGAPALAEFGKRITPNQHAIARRFGIFDNAYTNSQVSANGHNWTDAAFANDYVERFWPPNYGDRRALYDFQDAGSPAVPHDGYLWDAARRAHITYRDYGEDMELPRLGPLWATDFPGLRNHFDPRYYGWDLGYSDENRYREWRREFDGFVRDGNLPRLEIVYLPNDHTSGTRPGFPTPQAYVALNDWAVGQLVDAVSHSPYWKSSALFVLEDDAQNGPDHVSNQRSTFFIASPYALPGVHHEHYATASFVHTIELVTGLQPLSIYDRTALPLYAAFSTKADLRPYSALSPRSDIHALNAKSAYRASLSERLNFSRPDAIDPRVLNDLIAHAK